MTKTDVTPIPKKSTAAPRKASTTKAPATKATRTTASKTPAKKATTTTRKAPAAKKAPTTKAAPAAAIEVVDAKTRVARTAAAKAEHKSLAEWDKSDKKAPKPATPNLDAMNADHAAGKKAGAPRKAATPRTVQTVDFYVGERFLKGQNKLSSLAWYGTKDCGGSSSGGRMSATELKDALAKAKITEPTTTTWKWTAPNGLVLSARKSAK